MKPSSINQTNVERNCEVIDPISQNVYSLKDGMICVKSQADDTVSQYAIPQHFENPVKPRNSLRFRKLNNSNLVFSPSGHALTCKSDKIHEVDMNTTYTEGVALWGIACSSNCLSLIVGIKNVNKKKQQSFEFTIQNTTKISFKLDISGKKFKAWIYKSFSTVEKKINLTDDISEWTPFIRVKGAGVSVFLSQLIEDPENKSLSLNIFGTRSTKQQPKLTLSSQLQTKPNTQNYTIRRVDENTLLFQSQNDLRLFRRSSSQKQFDFSSLCQFSSDNKIFVSFNKDEQSVLSTLGFTVNHQAEQCNTCGKTAEQWTNWMICAFTLLDTRVQSGEISREVYNRGYEILLSKVEMFKGYIKVQTKLSAALQSDLQTNWGSNLSLLSSPSSSFLVPSVIRLNNEPSLKFQKQIKTVLYTEHFLVVLLAETERIVVINREDSLFKVIEFNLKKGFKKQHELNQYQKQLDLLQSNSATQPTIYKILKNCLKYADKVKPPEKQMKAIEEAAKKQKKNLSAKEKQKQKKQVKKVDPNAPDEKLINTLISMGFTEGQARAGLIESKNNLQKAIQVILSQPQKQVPKSPTKKGTSNKGKSWDCPQCTLLNDDSAQVCMACELPRPPVSVDTPALIEEVMQKEEQKVVEEEVESKNIESNLFKVFAWELGFAYCPLVVAGSFQNKLRLRLIGPNPKYYSMFYYRDEEFVDLTTLQIHKYAHQINQAPIRHQFYLNSTTAEQKESAYGWISIQDVDINVKGNVENVRFSRFDQSPQDQNKIGFNLHIQGQNNGQAFAKSVKIMITIDRIYTEKRKSITVEDKLDKKQQEVAEILEIPNVQDKNKLNSRQIPQNGYLEINLSRPGSKPSIKQVFQQSVVHDKITHTKPFVPIVAASCESSSQLTTLSSALQPGQKPLILRHLHNKAILAEYIVIEKLGKHATNSSYTGSVYFSEHPSTTQPLRKVQFKLEKGHKKFYIEAKQLQPTTYVVIQLEEQDKNNDNPVVEQLTLVGIIGDQSQRKNRRGPVKITNFNRTLQLKFNSKEGVVEKPKIKIETEILSTDYDLYVASEAELIEIVDQLVKNQSSIDLCVKIYNFEAKPLLLQTVQLEKFNTIRAKSHWPASVKPMLLQQSYKQLLEKFVTNCDISVIDQLSSEDHKDFYRLIEQGKYNLTKLLNQLILSLTKDGKKVDRVTKTKLINYFHHIAPYLPAIHKAGNLDYVQILKKVLQNQNNEIDVLQFVLEIGKSFNLEQDILAQSLIQRLTTVTKQFSKSKRTPQSESLLSRQIHYRPHAASSSSEPPIYSRYIVEHGKLYRKFTIDLLNLNKITNFALVFQKSHRLRASMTIRLKSCSFTSKGAAQQWKTEVQECYPEYVWEQVAVCPFLDDGQKTSKDVKKAHGFNKLYLNLKQSIIARYLELQIIFNVHPNIGSSKAIENCPQSQITPEINGEYYGEYEAIVGAFKSLDVSGLTFIKNSDGINRYNIKSLKNSYYYDSDQVQTTKTENQMVNSNKASKTEENKDYSFACIILDQLIARGSDELPQQKVQILLNSLSSLERGTLFDKIVLLLKKIAKNNADSAAMIFHSKLPNQHVLNSILRESALTSESITKILSGSPSADQLQNAIMLTKSRQQSSPALIQQIFSECLKSKRLDETVPLHERYGWSSSATTTKILDQALAQNNRKLFNQIIVLCKDNKQLANYAIKLLSSQEQGQDFNFVFEQLMKNNRKIKEEQVNDLLQSLIDSLQSSVENQETYDETEVNEKFTLLTSALNKLTTSPKNLIPSYISLFEHLPNKQPITNKFLSLKQFKNSEGNYAELLINLSLNLLNEYLSAKPGQNGVRNESLNLSYEIISFLFKADGLNAAVLQQIIHKNGSSITEVFGNLLVKQLSFGGEGNSKLIDSSKRLKLSLGYCLANLLLKLSTLKQKFEQNATVSQKCLRNLFKWLLITESSQTQKSSKSTVNSFAKIEQAAWLLVIVSSTKNASNTVKIFKQQFEKNEVEVEKIKNKVYKALFEKKMLSTGNKYLSKADEQSVNQKIIEELFSKYMDRIINKEYYQLEGSEADKNKAVPLTQKQYANNFQLQNESSAKVKDWLVYKNGAKSSVFKFDYPKGNENSYEMILHLTGNNQINLSKIMIGFEQTETAQEAYCIPRQITIQGAQKPNQFKFIGRLVQIPDNHYVYFSVRVFGLNCAQIQANKLSSSLNKYSEIKYLKITFKCPENGFAADALDVPDSAKTKNFGTSINFLSIQAYSSQFGSHPEIENILDFIKKISAYKHKQSLKKLFENQKNVTIFKDSLINWSHVMKNDQYADDINKFIMRVCQVNTQIGNQTISKYLHLGNAETCSKIVSEVILSSEESLKPRVLILHKFITENLQKLRSLEPFLNKFCQIVYAAEKNMKLKQTIQLQINTPKLCQIIKSDHNSQIFAKYLCTIMRLDGIFKSNNLLHAEIMAALFSSTSVLNKQCLQALIISDKSCRSWFMQNKLLQTLIERVRSSIKSKTEQSILVLKNDLQTLSSLCLNSNLKSIINKNRYNLDIFDMLVSAQHNAILVGEKNSQLRDSFVNFINRSVLGSENEKLVAQILKDSLVSSAVDQNKYFVGQVFLPILNSFAKTTICVHPYDSEEKKILIDMNIKNSKKLSKLESSEKSQTNKFRLPTNLISNKFKLDVFEKLKEKSKVVGGTFNLVGSHGLDAQGIFEVVQKSIKSGNQSMLFLFKTTSKSQHETLGIFYSEDSQVRRLPMYWNAKCVLFIAKQKEPIKFIDVTKQVGKQLITFFEQNDIDEYEGSGMEINYQSVPFCQICSSSVFGSSYINLDVLRGTSHGDYKLENAQYWTFDPVFAKQNNKVEQISLTDEILSMQNVSFFESAFESKSILRLLRSDSIYQFPLSLTLRELKLALQISKCKLKSSSQNSIKLRTMDCAQVNNDTVLLSLTKKEEDNPILDLLCDINDISSMLDFNSEGKSNATTYLPKRGIMKHFEEIDGVTSMIKVIKKSLEGWKNKERKEKWYQYVLELEKFSSFPHFFGMYLKDSETFDLLFKLLSGLPDTEQDKKWDQLEAKSTQKLLKIIADILSMDKTTQFREYAMKHDFFFTILERLRILTGQFKRQYKQVQQKEPEVISPSKQNNDEKDDGTKQIKKKKGVGYGNDGSSNTKWMKGATEAELMKDFEVTELILNIIENFLDLKHWNVPKKVLENVYQSALLPYLEEALRAGTLLQISKIPAKFKLVFKILRTLSKNTHLVPILMPIDKKYQPKQIQSLQSLMKSLDNTAKIFLSCLKQPTNTTSSSTNQKVSQELSKDIIQTFKLIQQAVQDYVESHHDQADDGEMKNILQMDLDKKYRMLLKDLRFDYIDMKQGAKIKHHYQSNFTANYVPNQNKMIRLAQQLADISTALPYQHTNAIFVRCDKDRVDFMQAMIMGSNGTPYGHGAYLFDIYFDDSYPNTPPKVNLTTTGHGKVRFNPNLYACGKVCLSLLGTWRGSASENWDPKVSTLLQVLVSIQAIIMSEEVYFNQPGFQGQQGTAEGQKKNQAYSNIVRYSNIKFAMVDNMKNPPKGFQHVVRRHFYLKQHQIMDECKKWLLYAEKRPANYIGLVNDHNSSWSAQFKKTKTQYKEMLEKAIQELDQQFKKLPVPSIHDIHNRKTQKKQKKKKVQTDMLKKLQDQASKQQTIDVQYDTKKEAGMGMEIDINDQKVKDRWSRYIGAMGIDAVSKQSKADILVFGVGPVALQVIKNLVLSGLRKLTIIDDKLVRIEDLSGGFFFTQADIGKNRAECILYKIRELNIYVKVEIAAMKDVTDQFLKTYSLVFVTELPLKEQIKLNQQCRANKVKFTSADFRGAHCRVFNDFGDSFEVLDKNGEEPTEVIIKSITNATNGVVTLLDGVKHPYEDGEVVHIKNVQGMAYKDDKTKSINGTLHKVKVINSKSFEIGDTTMYEPYIRNGLVKNVKTPVFVKFQRMKQVFESAKQKLPIDDNLQFYDFSKMSRNKQLHFCFVALDTFVEENGKLPAAWDQKDAEKLAIIFEKIYGEQVKPQLKEYVKRFSYVCSGYLPPLGAYLGGFISQEIIKAITQKYKPLDSVFYIDAEQIIPEIKDSKDADLSAIMLNKTQSRDKGFEIVVGKDLLEIIKNSTSFMIGSGAIGCELLKNFAMIGLGTGAKGKITLTDPDHIENSNLNRQFLFREKHISKPKSRTAAATVALMNQNLKGHISALLERVSESTKNVFSNKFFESLTFVANALDNVAARRYVDQRCVENKIPLFESGTLGPKGHTQVILPFKTESYGSQNDPVQQGEIPHCTLKMFPQQTLHCIEWARDIFGKKFSLQPKAFIKIKDSKFKPEKDDIKSINECLIMATKGPRNFEDCISYAITKFYKYFRDDILQLLYTYPLDAKTKDGEPFWKLPKRPPTAIMKFDPENILHCTFVSSLAVLVAKVYKIPFPKNFRQQKERMYLGKQASKIKIPDFVPSDEKAKSILKQIADEKKQNKTQDEQQKQKETQVNSDKSETELLQEFVKISKQMQVEAEQFEKDNDQNGHIDFIYSMANLRASNYKLDEMDWITTKLKAGRIVPALATTTTCVAGLQTLQICKYLRNLKLDLMRNSFLNLAVPSLQMSEPGQVKKIKLNDKVEVNLWDRWEIDCTEATTFGQVFEHLKKKYELNPIGVLQGMSRIDTSKTEDGKKQFLNSKLLDRLDKEDDNIDIVVLFTKQGQEKMLENIPPVRLRFENKKSA